MRAGRGHLSDKLGNSDQKGFSSQSRRSSPSRTKVAFVPTSAEFLIAYLGHGNRILDLMSSTDQKVNDKVEAGIDHLSRYAVAY